MKKDGQKEVGADDFRLWEMMTKEPENGERIGAENQTDAPKVTAPETGQEPAQGMEKADAPAQS